MADAVDHAYRHVVGGGLPFVGVVVTADGWVSAPGVNQVLETGDPTAHAEVVAMRMTAKARGAQSLSGATLLATGEPCYLCYRLAAQQGVSRVAYAVDQGTAATWGFDYRTTADTGSGVSREQLPTREALAPFAAYLDRRHQPRPAG